MKILHVKDLAIYYLSEEIPSISVSHATVTNQSRSNLESEDPIPDNVGLGWDNWVSFRIRPDCVALTREISTATSTDLLLRLILMQIFSTKRYLSLNPRLRSTKGVCICRVGATGHQWP